MKDLGFNEFGELAGGENDEENLAKPQTEMTSISSASVDHDADGTLEEEDAEIALWWKRVKINEIKNQINS